MYKYLMIIDDGSQVTATFSNPVSKGDQVYYQADKIIEPYMVFEVKHAVGGGSTIVCDKM